MLIKTIAIVAFIAILASLGTALFNLVRNKDPEHSRKTLRALTVRISLSLLLLIGLIVAYSTGLFQPQGIGARIEQIHTKQAQATQENLSATAQ
ncbi:MAG: twin transmembrane helix small protein [Methylomonas sp.]